MAGVPALLRSLPPVPPRGRSPPCTSTGGARRLCRGRTRPSGGRRRGGGPSVPPTSSACLCRRPGSGRVGRTWRHTRVHTGCRVVDVSSPGTNRDERIRANSSVYRLERSRVVGRRRDAGAVSSREPNSGRVRSASRSASRRRPCDWRARHGAHVDGRRRLGSDAVVGALRSVLSRASPLYRAARRLRPGRSRHTVRGMALR